MLIDKLLKASLRSSLDNIVASDFTVKSSHYPVLQIQIKVYVDFAVPAGISPDCRGRRLASLLGLPEPVLGIDLAEANEPIRADRRNRRRRFGRFGRRRQNRRLRFARRARWRWKRRARRLGGRRNL